MAITLAPNRKAAIAALGGPSHPIAVVTGGESDGQRLWLNPDVRGAAHTRVDLAPDSHFGIEPNNDPTARDLLWVYGASGSGKSHILKGFALRYRALYPRRPIVLVSQLKADTTLDAIAQRIGLRRINVETLVQRPLELDELHEALVLIDDVEGMAKPAADAVLRTAELIASQGRHTHTSLLYSTHLASHGQRTRLLLSEMQSYVCFAHGCSYSGLKGLLERYGGLDKDTIKAARRLQSRWFMVSKRYPPFVVSDGSAYLLNSDI